MNAERRAKLEEAGELARRALELVEEVSADEQDAFDNMPEGLQSSERGEKMEAAVSLCEDAISELNSAIDSIEEARS